MSFKRYLPKFAVSLYVLLFLFAIWYAIGTSVPGSASTDSITGEPQPFAVELSAVTK
jgi:hypothetical protein